MTDPAIEAAQRAWLQEGHSAPSRVRPILAPGRLHVIPEPEVVHTPPEWVVMMHEPLTLCAGQPHPVETYCRWCDPRIF